MQAFLNPTQTGKNKIKVYARIRPMFLKELLEKDFRERSYFANDTVIQIEGKHTSCELFKCNKVFGESSTQEEVFEPLKPLIESSVDGFRATVFAFGPTGSGKSHTV